MPSYTNKYANKYFKAYLFFFKGRSQLDEQYRTINEYAMCVEKVIQETVKSVNLG